MQHIDKYKHSDQRYSLNQRYNTAQHQYTRSTTPITHEADPVLEGRGSCIEAADIIQTPEETTRTQVIHAATVEIHNTNTGQNAKPSKLNVIFATD